MKLKSTLWALAFACAAVSCSDDEIINGPNNEEGGATAEGPQTYMTVTLNTPTTTKANPMGGEEGDGYEVGEENEWTVKDVTVILFTDKDGNTPTTFSADCDLVGAGYKDNLQMSVSDTEHHNRQATVTVSIKDGNFDEKTYGVITVTNWGSDALKERITNEVTNGAQLANLLVTDVHGENNAKFIMSTHNDQYDNNTKIFDKVTLKANATPENAPQATVHVERLAAKVRVKAYQGDNAAAAITNFIYTLNSGNNNEAKVRLNQVAIVNQLTSGTYLLKRVANTVDNSKEIAALAEDGHDTYLGNETADENGAGTNYVINPWTRAIDQLTISENFDWSNLTVTSATHTAASTSNATTTTNLSYIKGVAGKATFNDLWKDVESNAGKLGEATEFTPYVVYTQENTTSAKMSKNGFSTGALFQATYLPKKWMAVTEGEDKKQAVKAVEIDYNGKDTEGTGYDDLFSTTTLPENFVFYVYRGNIYKDYEAIFNAYVWLQQKEVEGQTGASIYDYSDFKSDKITQLKKSDFKNSLLYQFANAEPLGYLAYLKSKCSDSDNAEATFSQGEDIDSYIASEDGKAKIAENVNTYENGTCYYPYWIRHANNNKPNEMGIMEFGIVRNNIYELAVKSISSLGLSGVDKPEPDKDDETNEVFFSVEIKVKDWILRKNNDIIL